MKCSRRCFWQPAGGPQHVVSFALSFFDQHGTPDCRSANDGNFRGRKRKAVGRATPDHEDRVHMQKNINATSFDFTKEKNGKAWTGFRC